MLTHCEEHVSILHWLRCKQTPSMEMGKTSLQSNLCMAKYRSDYIISLNINDLAASLHSIFMAKRERKKSTSGQKQFLQKNKLTTKQGSCKVFWTVTLFSKFRHMWNGQHYTR